MTTEKATLSSPDIERAADALVRARLDNSTIDDLPEGARPRNLADAYAVQDRFVEKLGWAIGGWYCACTNEEIQCMLGLREPYWARLFDRFILKSPARLDSRLLPPIVLECEFGFRLGWDLPHREAPYSRSEVQEAIASVHPTIEVVAGHLRDWQKKDVFSVIADNGTDGALVWGEGIPYKPGLDLSLVAVALEINGVVVRRGTGANVLGDPLAAFIWLANARAAVGDGLKAGQIHNTGTAIQMHSGAADDYVVADFASLGKAELEIV